MVEVINFSEQSSVMNLFMAEIRDKKYQQNRLLFRNNIERIGQMMAFELTKTLEYRPKTVTTPLGTLDIPLPHDELVIATVLRAGLPFHEGFLKVNHGDGSGDHFSFATIFVLLRKRHPSVLQAGEYQHLCP